jgi:hypothetical protein
MSLEKTTYSQNNTPPFLLILIIAMGAVCRFYNLNWDDGYIYHPDEMNITAAVSRISIPSQMDPGFFAYNGFPIYLYRAIAEMLSRITNNNSWIREWSKITLIGRFISALASTLSIYLIYWIGKNLINEKAALLAAFLTAVTVGLIQTAHYGVTESLLLFFLLVICIYAIRIIKEGETQARNWFLMAIISGLAIGTKTSAASFLVIPLVVWILLFFKRKKSEMFLQGVLFFLITLITSILVSPYSLLNFPAFRTSMKYEGEVVWGILKVPYTLQFYKTIPYWFFYKNLHWHTGLIIPTLGTIGIFLWLFSIWKKRAGFGALPILLFGIIYFGYVGSWYTKFIRYMIPMIPILILSTCWMFNKLLDHKKTRLLGILLVTITLLTTTAWATSFISIYSKASTRTAASQWIYKNIPKNSTVLIEHWDYALPVALRHRNRSAFQYVIMQNFDPDTEEKVADISRNLKKGDYLILASQRLSGTIGKTHDIYPITSRYYKKLFDGNLGYTLLKTSSSYPQLCGLEINDDAAEETFQVFDHPVVHIFKNSKRLSALTIMKVLKE